MCWNPDTPPAAGPYALCWDEPSSSQVGSVPAITVEAATPLAAATYDVCWDGDPQSTTADVGHPYDMCWDDRPATSAAGYQGGFDMCWGDAQLGGDGDCEGHLTAAPTTGSVNSGVNNSESPGSQDIQASLAPSSAPSEGSTITQVEAGEELLRRADNRLDRLCAILRDNESEAVTEIIRANQALITNYQNARNQYVTATNDMAKIQHMLQMFRQIDDPLTVLELGRKKAGG
ncbi:hypothetical protein DFJ58DRAFT_725314 [Suillus subalutaceus]|uniref:uncharacterized protein n=1 Tax=Suillus subalutaceus TaxID=48586 RepID=UPI001B85E44F|nr:uncharacterized protein DFJ58DRAFT_725314 [Suillus subalutaceus]KAG1862830.1 hypothetical protein DFJ58DRAFT_725314 [Suillus subalutaceus]